MTTKKLITGEKVKLADYVTSENFEIHVKIDSSMTIDICCFGLDVHRKLSDDKYMVFYNQPQSPEKAIRLTANEQKKTIFLTAPHKLPSKIKNLVFTAAIDGIGTMSAINTGYLAFFANSKEIIRFDFSGQNFKNERAIIIGEVYFKDVWRLGAVGQGFNGGLSALLNHFGGEEIIEENPNSATIAQESNGFKHYFSLLDSPMKKAYQATIHGLKNFSDSIVISQNGEISDSSLSDLMTAVKLDNPSIFYLESTYQYTTSGSEIRYKPAYSLNTGKIQDAQNKLSKVIDDILKSTINESMTDYEKELALHNYLVKNVVYDYASLSMQNPPAEIYTAYGALINKKCVCSGYANAMKMLLDKCGIECLIVTGDSKIPSTDSSVGHAWNIVKIENNFYHLDVTWDAPINKKPGEIFHSYFNVTDAEISVDHTWDVKTPECHSTKHNYYVYHDLAVSDDSKLREKIKHVIQNKKQTLSFKYVGSNASSMNTEKLNAMISDVWQNRLLAILFGSGSISWSTSYNERQKSCTVEFSY